jgi:hypothetical protein
MVVFPSRRGITPVFGYTAPHPSGRGTSTLRIKTLPSTHYEPVRHPSRPGLSLAGVRLRAATPHRLGLPVLPRISSAGMLSPIPRWDRWTMSFARRISHPLRGPATAAFPGSRAGRLPHHCFRGLLSVHYPLRPARSRGHSLALSIEGSGGFVTSTAAPIASGWSDPDAGRGLHPRKTRALPRRTYTTRYTFDST